MTKSVLVVEDDRDIRDALRESLVMMGYRVDVASNGEEALRFLAEHEKPAVILLDLMMPVMDGWQFRVQQQLDPRICDIPVVLITADGNAKHKADNMGAHDRIKKPFEFEELIKIAHEFCGPAQ